MKYIAISHFHGRKHSLERDRQFIAFSPQKVLLRRILYADMLREFLVFTCILSNIANYNGINYKNAFCVHVFDMQTKKNFKVISRIITKFNNTKYITQSFN